MVVDSGVTRSFEVVVKLSKLCNLRCRYCYELPELGNPAAMSRRELGALYRNVRDYVTWRDAHDGKVTQVTFIWHGGEPLVQDPQGFWDSFADQAEVFADRISVVNSVQTNLVLFDEERRRLLVEGFDEVGVSLDVVGGLRVNLAGKDLETRVVGHYKQLLQLRPAGAITVLTSKNIGHVDEIFRFYEQLGTSFRLLPLFDTDDPIQTHSLSITTEQEVNALCRVFDLWLESETMPRPPSPLRFYLRSAIDYLSGGTPDRYVDRRSWLPALLVNTDGSCYTPGEPYGDPAWSIGNIFTVPLEEMLEGEAYERCVRAAETRQAFACLPCPFFGHCDGRPVADNEIRARDLDEAGHLTCPARPVIEHITTRLTETMPAIFDPARHTARNDLSRGKEHSV